MDKVPEKNLVSVPGEAIEQALAKTIETLGVNTATGISGAIGSLFGAAFMDRVNEIRRRRQILGLKMTAKRLAENGVDLSKLTSVPEYAVYTIFDGFAHEADDQVRELWSGLLVKMMTAVGKSDLTNRLVGILKQLDGQDVAILKTLNVIENGKPKSNPFTKDKHGNVNGLSEEYTAYHSKCIRTAKETLLMSEKNVIDCDIHNLLRLGLISYSLGDASPNRMQLEILDSSPGADEFSMAMKAYFSQFGQNLGQQMKVISGVQPSVDPPFEISVGSQFFPESLSTKLALTQTARHLLLACDQAD